MIDIKQLLLKFNATNIEKLDKGWSKDVKYIMTIHDDKYLLRLTDINEYEEKKKQYEYLKQIAKLDIYCSKVISFGTIENYVYMLFTYLEGTSAEEILVNDSNYENKNLSGYALGYIAGTYLKKIHSVKIKDNGISIYDRFNEKLKRKIQALKDCPLKIKDEEMLINYINENKEILKDRKKVLTHGDYHLGNMIFNDNKGIGIIDFNKLKEEDPYDDFKPFVWSVRRNNFFQSGLINGYFNNKVPSKFFKLLKLYVAESLISHIPWAYTFGEKEIKTGYEIYDLLMKWYDNFNEEIPTWYVKPLTNKYVLDNMLSFAKKGVLLKEVENIKEIHQDFINKNKFKPIKFENNQDNMIDIGFKYLKNEFEDIINSIDKYSNIHLFFANKVFKLDNPLSISNMFSSYAYTFENKNISLDEGYYLDSDIPCINNGVIIWDKKYNNVYYIVQDCGYHFLKYKREG